MFTKNRLILILGLWVAFMPFLGFPYSFEEGIYICAGLGIALLSFLLARHMRKNRRAFVKKQKTDRLSDSQYAVVQKEIVESDPFAEDHTTEEDELLDDELPKDFFRGQQEKEIEATPQIIIVEEDEDEINVEDKISDEVGGAGEFTVEESIADDAVVADEDFSDNEKDVDNNRTM